MKLEIFLKDMTNIFSKDSFKNEIARQINLAEHTADFLSFRTVHYSGSPSTINVLIIKIVHMCIFIYIKYIPSNSFLLANIV